MRRAWVVLLLCVPSFAGVTYTSVTKIEAGMGSAPVSNEVRIRAWVDSGNVKTEMTGSGLFPAGSYLLKRTDNAAVLMVNPGNKSYAVWDLEQVLGEIAKSAKSAFRVEDAKWEKVSEEDGGQVSGYRTEHYHFRFGYTMVVTIEGKDERAAATMDQEFWTTDKLADPGMAAAATFGFVQQLSGLSPEIEQMTRAEAQEMKGFPLKQQWTVHSTMDGDKAFEQKITTTVTDVQIVDLPASVFAVPAEYKLTAPVQFDADKEMKKAVQE